MHVVIYWATTKKNSLKYIDNKWRELENVITKMELMNNNTRKREKGTQNMWNKQKTNGKVVDLNPDTLVITLNVN